MSDVLPSDLMLVGIDPAPSKHAAVVLGRDAESVTTESWHPQDVRRRLDDLRRDHPRLLVAWDAPLSFSPRHGFSDRPVDRAVRAFLKGAAVRSRVTEGAVSALPFSGCPHWAITSAALGRPFGDTAGFGMPSHASDVEGTSGAWVIEVHPAVSIALWCLADTDREPMGRYKAGGGLKADAVRTSLRALGPSLVRRTGLTDRFFASDDLLDASVAWSMAAGFACGQAAWVGNPEIGGYVLPRRESEVHELSRRVADVARGWK